MQMYIYDSAATLKRPSPGTWTRLCQLRALLVLTFFAIICRAQKDDSNAQGGTKCENNTNTYVQNFSSSIRVKQWVDQPNFRGTFDILWTCLVTIFISTYTMLCLNIPA